MLKIMLNYVYFGLWLCARIWHLIQSEDLLERTRAGIESTTLNYDVTDTLVPQFIQKSKVKYVKF